MWPFFPLLYNLVLKLFPSSSFILVFFLFGDSSSFPVLPSVAKHTTQGQGLAPSNIIDCLVGHPFADLERAFWQEVLSSKFIQISTSRVYNFDVDPACSIPGIFNSGQKLLLLWEPMAQSLTWANQQQLAIQLSTSVGEHTDSSTTAIVPTPRQHVL